MYFFQSSSAPFITVELADCSAVPTSLNLESAGQGANFVAMLF